MGLNWSEIRDAGKVLGGLAILIGSGGTVWQPLALAVSDVYGRDQRRKLARKARQEFNASLRDRFQMVRSATEARRLVYGRARISGPIVYAQSTGAKKEFLHLVVALAGHECDAIETIYFNDIALPAEDGSGLIQSGEFCSFTSMAAAEQFTATSFSTAQTPTSVQLVTRTNRIIHNPDNPANDEFVQQVLNEGVNYTRAGAAFTIIDGGGFGTSISVNYTYAVSVPRVRIKKFLGTTSQAASSDLISESGGKWTSAHQLKGICYVYVRLEYDQDVFGQVGLPNVSAIIRGRKVFDTRSSTTAWTENAALCARDYLADATYGMGASAAELPTAEINTAANECDELVTIYSTGTCDVTNGSPTILGVGGTLWLTRVRAGMIFIGPSATQYTILSVNSNTSLTLTANYVGSTDGAYTISEPRYTCNGVLDSADAPRDNLDKLVEAMAGTAVWTQGRWLVNAGAHTSSVLTITEDLLGDAAPVISPRSPRRELVNRVVATYAEPGKLYTPIEAPPVTNATYVTDDGGLDLSVEVTYDMCTGGVRAQRLAKIYLEQLRQALTVTLSCNLKAYDLSPSDTVALTLARYGWSAKLFTVLKRTLNLQTMQIDLVLRETASAVWDWSLGAETAVDLTPNTDLPSPFAVPATLASLAADSSIANALLGGNGSITPRVKITWTQSTEVFVVQGGSIQVQFKSDEATVWVEMPSVDGSATSAYLSPVQGNRLILIRIRPVNARGRVGLWTTISHQTAELFNPGSIGGGNYLRNASFEQDVNATGLADAWLAYSAGTVSGITYTRPIGLGGTSGQRAAATTLGATPSTDRLGIYQQSINLAGLAGMVLSVSAWFTASSQTDMKTEAVWFIDGAALTTESGTALTFDDGSTVINASATSTTTVVADNTTQQAMRRASDVMQVPATAGEARLYYYITPQSGRPASVAFVLFDDVQLEIGAAPTAYAPKTDEILANVVGTEQIAPEAVGTTELAALAVTNEELADNAVVSRTIPARAVNGGHVELLSLAAEHLKVGALRGRNLQGSAHVTKGTFLTAVPAAAATTVEVDNTEDFAISGTAVIIDTANDRDQFTYTGKTETTLTGCSGVLGSHTLYATVVPLVKGMVIDANTNEMRFFGDRGDGVVEELASVGVVGASGDSVVGYFGSSGATRIGAIGRSNTNFGLEGYSTATNGVLGLSDSSTQGAVKGFNHGSGPGVHAVSDGGGNGLQVDGNATKGHMVMSPLAARPSTPFTGDVSMLYTTGGSAGSRNATPRLCMYDGTNWIFVHDNTTFAG